MVNSDPDGYLKTVKIIKRYFSPGTPLATEKEVFDVITRSRGLSPTVAGQVLREVRDHVKNLDARKIEIKKSNVIKEIHHTFGQEFFDVHRIPEYRLLASIQMLVEQYKASNRSLSENVGRAQLEEGMLKYMSSVPAKNNQQPRGEKIDGVVATLAMKKFEERYSGTLNEDQKKTLRKFMNYTITKNDEQFIREMTIERESILKTLSESRGMECFKSDPVMGEKLSEAVNNLRSLDLKENPSKSVEEILMYHKLVQEVRSDE